MPPKTVSLRITILLIWIASYESVNAQNDSLVNNLTNVPIKYFKEVDNKIVGSPTGASVPTDHL